MGNCNVRLQAAIMADSFVRSVQEDKTCPHRKEGKQMRVK